MLKNFTITRLYFLLLCLVTASLADASTLYWVNNGGNWNDAHHWATVSGGKGGAGIPNSTDDVIFDANSFDDAGEVVSITGTATCHTMQWAKDAYNPVLSGNKFTFLNIYGSFDIPLNVDMKYEGAISFKSSQTGNTINTGGRILSNVFNIDG